jgi:hypothetical protein
MRNPQGRQQYDNIFFRNHCKELLQVPMLMVREFLKNRLRLCCFIGLENSPTCGIHWGRHKVNRYGTESPNSEEGYEKSLEEPGGSWLRFWRRNWLKKASKPHLGTARPFSCRFGQETTVLERSGGCALFKSRIRERRFLKSLYMI